MHRTLFGNGVSTDITKLRRGHTKLGWALIQYGWCPYQRKGKEAVKDGDWSYAAIAKECLGLQKLEDARKDPPLEPSRCGSALGLNSQPSQL